MGRAKAGVALLSVMVAVGVALTIFLLSAPEGFRDDINFVVRDGEALTSLAKRLEDYGVIRSAWLLRVYSILRGTQTQFQKGEYLLTRGSGLTKIHDQIVEGRLLLIRVTFPEGWTSTRMSSLVEQKGIALAHDFLSAVSSGDVAAQWNIPAPTLEGFLYPDTYLFPKNAGGKAVVVAMVRQFFQVLESIKPGASYQNPVDLYATVVLASIVEREYRAPEEAATIASVFRNRLRWNIPLGSCATIAYIITEIQGKPYPRRIFYSDTKIPSPFNTYINRGLPPSPISNPGLVALRSSFFPAQTDYLFFVVKDPVRGTHTFTSTMVDHLQAREAYLNNFVLKD